MFKNYFTVALRNFWRSKIFSLIHILGLSIGISASIVIYLIAHYELSFDKFEKDRDQVYRIVMDINFNGTVGHSPAVPAPLSPAVQQEVTGVQISIPVMQFQGDGTVKVTVTPARNNKPIVFKKQAEVIFTNAGYCVGLLGLVMYTSETRAKEIGIRKLLGASVTTIINLLSREFVQLVLIAFAIAAPLSWWVVDHWLQSFAYRTPISWWVFAVSGLFLLIVAVFTLSVQTVKTAMENPVKSLRAE